MKKLIVLLMSAIFILTGCGSSSSGTEGTTFVYADAPIEGLDISMSTYQQTFQIFADIYEGIYEVNGEGELVLSGAEEVTVSDDGLVYTIKLNEDAVWVDNTGEEMGPVTAHDYVFSYQRTVDPATGSGYSYIFEPIKNASAIIAGEMPVTELGVKAVDDYTLEITLERPTPYFTSMLAFQTFYPQPVEASEQYGDDFATGAEYTWYNGAYYPSSYDKEYEIVMDQNPSYHGEAGDVEQVIMKVQEDAETAYNMYNSGELSMVKITNPDYYEIHTEDGTIEDRLTGYMYYMYINVDPDRATSNENLRYGLAYGFDRDTIAQQAYGGINQTITYLVPDGMTPAAYEGLEYRDYADEDLITYDKEKADQYFDAYMAEMGYTSRDQIEVTFLINDSSGGKKLGEALQGFYQQTFGITVNVDVQPMQSYITKKNEGDFDMTISGWGPDYSDPTTYLGLFKSDAIGTLNTARYDNPEYDAAYDEAAKIVDPEARFEAFAELEKQVVESGAVVPFYQKNEPVLIADGYTVPYHLFLKVPHKYVTYTEQ